MRNIKMLEMINDGKVEELKTMLQDEIYKESLKAKPNAKKRYMAMKKYFSYTDSSREALRKPCEVEYEGRTYTSFCNSYSLVLTTESVGEIELFDKEKGNYPDVTRLIRFDGKKDKIDISKVIASAKSKGYKLKKSELGFNYKYLMHYEGSYFKIGLLDATCNIIYDGESSVVYHKEGKNNPLTIITELGIAYVLPIRYDGNPEDEVKIVIYVDEQKE